MLLLQNIFLVIFGVTSCVYAVDPLSMCSENLVTGPFGVSDDRITASSTLKPTSPNGYTGPERARLNTTAQQLTNGTYLYGAWSANANTKKEYIQVEFNDVSVVRGIYTQGRNLLPSDKVTPEYLALYRVAVSNDGVTWTPITDTNGREKFFRGNIDSDTIEYNELPCAQLAKYVRIYPEAWSQHVSFRFDVKGCQIDTSPPQAPSTTTISTSTTTTKTAPTTTMTSPLTSAAMTTSPTLLIPSTTGAGAVSIAPLAGGPKNCIRSKADCSNKMGDFPSCHNCDGAYITCIYGIAYRRPCPAGLQWNENAKVCDWPNVVGCP